MLGVRIGDDRARAAAFGGGEGWSVRAGRDDSTRMVRPTPPIPCMPFRAQIAVPPGDPGPVVLLCYDSPVPGFGRARAPRPRRHLAGGGRAPLKTRG
jgi:hypothetical protein